MSLRLALEIHEETSLHHLILYPSYLPNPTIGGVVVSALPGSVVGRILLTIRRLNMPTKSAFVLQTTPTQLRALAAFCIREAEQEEARKLSSES